MDADGYVTITGRLKEIINRGGEKISPREVDEIIDGASGRASVRHVRACRTTMLGEDVAAAVVLKQGSRGERRELREFAPVRLADFKVPQEDSDSPRRFRWRDGQAPAHRTRTEAGARMTQTY